MTDQPIATTRRGDVPKRPKTPGARERDLTREVDYGGEVGVVTETYARQTVVDAYPPGATEPRTVTEKAYANIYRDAGWTLEPNADAPGPLDDDRLAAAARVADEAERDRAAAEEEAERLATEAETARRAQERAEAKAAEEAAARAAAEEETARLRAELEAARAATPAEAAAPAPDEQPAKPGGKAAK